MTNRRHYFLPLDRRCLNTCRFCFRAGCKNHSDRGSKDLEQIFLRAKSGGYSHIEFSSSVLLFEGFPKILEALDNLQLSVVIQIDHRSFREFHPLPNEIFRMVEWNVLFDEADGPIGTDLIENPQIYFSFFPRTVTGALEFLSRNPLAIDKLHIHSSPFNDQAETLSARETHILLEKVKKTIPNFIAKPPMGREVWDPRIDPDLKLDASLNPAFESKMGDADPFFSVVVPTFNSKLLVKNVIKHLLEQSYDRSRFEIIVVDDGSSDGTQEYIRNFLSPEFGSCQFSYLYFPRSKARNRGDGNFRAGIARNQGVKAARGKLLCFLDSDIIVPQNFLQDLEEKHKTFDVIQNIRLHLKNKKGNETLNYDSVSPKKDTFVQEAGYWSKLFQTKNWESLPFFWKYTCTYSLSLPKELFQRVGWFRKTFVFYGFEDTDLGYRLWQAGAKFHLNPMITYHLETSEDRTEYKRSAFERHAILSKTAKIFYLNNLNSEIFLHFYSMMGGEKSYFRQLSRQFFRFKAKNSIQPTNPKMQGKHSAHSNPASLAAAPEKNVSLH